MSILIDSTYKLLPIIVDNSELVDWNPLSPPEITHYISIICSSNPPTRHTFSSEKKTFW